MTKNIKLAVYVTPDMKERLDAASAESGVPISKIANMALREFMPPPYEIRKRLREATLAVGRKRAARSRSKDGGR